MWEGEGVILGARKMMGATKPSESNPGTIRGDFCVNVGRNIIHGSDGPASAAKEIAFWFKPEEVVTHVLCSLLFPSLHVTSVAHFCCLLLCSDPDRDPAHLRIESSPFVVFLAHTRPLFTRCFAAQAAASCC